MEIFFNKSLEIIKDEFTKSQHFIIQIESEEEKQEITSLIVNTLQLKDEEYLCIDISDNNIQGDDKHSFNKIKTNDIINAKVCILSAFNTNNKDAFLKYTFLTNNKLSFFITNNIVNENEIFSNPTFLTLQNIKKIVLNKTSGTLAISDINLINLDNNDDYDNFGRLSL